MPFRRWVWMIAAVSLVVLVPLGGGIYWVCHRASLYYDAAATLPAEIAAARKEGLPLLPVDLNPPADVPDNENAAPYYVKITQVAKTVKEDPWVSHITAGTATVTERRAATEAFARNPLLLQLAEQAAALPDCDFRRAWKLGPNLPIPEYGPMRTTARFLAAKATLECDAGHPEAALHTVQVGARMAHHAGQDPILIAMLVQIAVEAIMDRPLQRIIRRYGDRADVLQVAEQTEQAFGSPPNLRRALSGEVVQCRIMAAMFRSDNLDIGARMPLVAFGLPREVVADAYEAHSISYWRKVFAAIHGGPGDPMADYVSWLPIQKAHEEAGFTPDGKAKPTYELDAILSPYFALSSQKVVVNAAQRRVRRTLLALMKYRRAAGRFPDELSALSPTAPLDPFTNRPLHYLRTKTGFLLYSVGVNLVDDGGNAMPPKKGDAPLDIVASFP